MNAAPSPTNSTKEHENTPEPTGRLSLLQEIGQKLNQSRESSGESIEEVVRKLKLRKRHLLALEHGNWDNLPDDVYVLGFLRQYSQYLNVDLSDEIHRLKNDQYALTKPLTFPDPPVAPSRRWAWLAGVAFVLLFILFNVTTENHVTNHTEDTESQSTPIAREDTTTTLQTTHKTQAASDLSEPIMTGSENETPLSPSPVIDTPNSDAPVTGETARTEQASESIPSAESKPVSPQTELETAPAQTQVGNSAMHHFRFDAVGSPVWLQISMSDPSGIGKGQLFKEVLLQPGSHTTIRKQTESLWITCGNAPALRITVDGAVFAASGSLGAGKKVLRDYRFSLDSN